MQNDYEKAKDTVEQDIKGVRTRIVETARGVAYAAFGNRYWLVGLVVAFVAGAVTF